VEKIVNQQRKEKIKGERKPELINPPLLMTAEKD